MMKIFWKIRMVLPEAMAYLTGRQRYLPKMEWSRESFVFNLFRIYEQIFFRDFEQRFETAVGWNNGYTIVRFGTIESFFCYVEGVIRGKVKVAIPSLVFTPSFAPIGLRPMPSNYLFAIAYETSANGSGYQSASTITYSITPSGANRLMISNVFAGRTGTGHTSSVVFNTSESHTKIDEQQEPDQNAYVSLWYLVNPSTGAHNNVVTFDDSSGGISEAAVYSGVAQSAPIDSQTKGSAVTALLLTTTVVKSNCWLVAGYRTLVGQPTATLGATQRQSEAAGAGIFDSNGTVGTGSQSMTVSNTSAGQKIAGNMVSFMPPQSSIKTVNGLASPKSVNGLAAASMKTRNGLQ